MRRLSLILLQILTALSLVLATPLQAQSYNLGYSKYSNGDFAGAERALQGALPKAKASAEKAKIYKLLGLCQYTRGDKTRAAASFRAALQSNPATTISADEALDDSVVAFFNAQRGTSKTPPKAPSAPAREAHTIGATAPRSTTTANKTTTLVVDCNVASASVAIDGIMAGSVGRAIEVDPGKITVDITANGYQPRRFLVQAVRLNENRIRADLTKILPRATPTPTAAPVARATPVPAKTAKPGGGLFSDKDVALQGSGAAGRDLASEFQMDAATGGGTATTPQQPGGMNMRGQVPPQQPMPYGQPPSPYGAQPYGYPPQQPYGYPPQPYGYPPQQPYGYPPQQPYGAYPPPNPYGYGAYPPVAPQQPMAPVSPPTPPPPVAADPSSSGGSSGGSTKSSESDYAMLINILPFGAGQFQNGDHLLGVALAAGQVGGLVYWYMMYSEYNSYYTTESARIEQMGQTEEARQYAIEVNNHLSELQTQQYIGLGVFGGLWGAGIVQAVIREPDQPKKRVIRRSRYSLFNAPNSDLLAETNPDTLSSDSPLPSEGGELRWQAGLGIPAGHIQDPRLGLVTSLTWTF